MTESAVKYKDHILGDCVEEVMDRFMDHPGEMDMKPFGFDVHQAIEFGINEEGYIYQLSHAAAIDLPSEKQEQILENLREGAVELYLRRPTVGIEPFVVTNRKLLHAATGRQIPWRRAKIA